MNCKTCKNSSLKIMIKGWAMVCYCCKDKPLPKPKPVKTCPFTSPGTRMMD